MIISMFSFYKIFEFSFWFVCFFWRVAVGHNQKYSGLTPDSALGITSDEFTIYRLLEIKSG